MANLTGGKKKLDPPVCGLIMARVFRFGFFFARHG
jgi:hypothetical protein